MPSGFAIVRNLRVLSMFTQVVYICLHLTYYGF